VTDRLVSLGVAGPGTFDERGLLGVAFHPDYASTGLLYTYTSEPVAGSADFSTMPPDTSANHQSVISEWQVPVPGDPTSVADPSTRREVFRIDQPQFNHNAGALNFGPDGDLYISLGDGGAADDQGVGHVTGGNGQDPGNVLGAILRIDPGGSDSANGQYGVPVDNPFAGTTDGADEIYAYGFRNPFRFSFDPVTGELFAADVGQNDIEEVDLVAAGGNYGWRVKEGTFLFDPNGADAGFVTADSPGSPAGLTDPVLQYDHDEGIAVVGGFIYRGHELDEELFGKYLFGDYFFPAEGGGRLLVGNLATGQIRELLSPGDMGGLSLLGFGRDGAGELYLLANATGVPFGESGVVLRLTRAVPAPGTLGLVGLGLAALGFLGRERAI
ncbi:MAG: CHRD domain-containing protein, partial [Gemmatimonadetes bacterium]|nr:CHRD domain-containing protein [Gemmatimonadota bacterium]